MKLSLREIMLVVLVAALAMGWWFDNRRLHAKYQDELYRSELLAVNDEIKQAKQTLADLTMYVHHMKFEKLHARDGLPFDINNPVGTPI